MTPPDPSTPSDSIGLRKKLLFSVVVFVVLPIAVLAGIEGASSMVLLVRDLSRMEARSERLHAEYDSLLGWTHKPEVYIADIYGPGRYLRTNAQRFRANHPTPPQRAPGRYRVICAGDSYTLGYGVSNDSTWCHLLGGSHAAVETVNMGQAGYGIDQAFLWYQRDGLPLEHDALIFAYITDDFRRVAVKSFEGQPKPVLRVRGQQLVVENVPVPRPLWAGWRSRYGPAIDGLRLSQLIARLRQMAGQVQTDLLADSANVISEVTGQIVHELGTLAARDRRLVVLVHLPSTGEYQFDHSKPWRHHMAAAAASANVLFIDLIEELRRLPPDRASSFFARGHYNEAGNAWVAATLRSRLDSVPAFGEGRMDAQSGR